MYNITLICVGKLKEKFYTGAAEEYIKRLRGYCALETVELQERRLPSNPSTADITAALEKESAEIMGKLPKGAVVTAMCSEGLEMDSEQLSKLISGYADAGVSRLCFVIGGSYGLHDDVKNRAELKLSLSRMTFPRSLARVILLEQLYRSLNIAEGGKYHKLF